MWTPSSLRSLPCGLHAAGRSPASNASALGAGPPRAREGSAERGTAPLARVRQQAHWSDRIAHRRARRWWRSCCSPSSPRRWQRSCVSRCRTPNGRFVGLANFIAYAQTPALLDSLWNSLWVSALVTLITIPAAFGFAYALTRSRMRFKALFRGITLIPLLAPSLLSAISLIYWFGNQGAAEGLARSASASSRSTARRASCWPRSSRCSRMR